MLASGVKGTASHRIAISKGFETHHKQPRPSHVLGAPDAPEASVHPILRLSSPRDTRTRRDLASNRPASISVSGLCDFRDRGGRTGISTLHTDCLACHFTSKHPSPVSPRQCMSHNEHVVFVTLPPVLCPSASPLTVCETAEAHRPLVETKGSRERKRHPISPRRHFPHVCLRLRSKHVKLQSLG